MIKRANELALEICLRRGVEVVPILMLEASIPKNGVERRLRALRAIARIGTVLDPQSSTQLFGMLGEKNPRVRKAAAELFFSRRQGRPICSIEKPQRPQK